MCTSPLTQDLQNSSEPLPPGPPHHHRHHLRTPPSCRSRPLRMPYYYHLKFGLLLWLQLPQTQVCVVAWFRFCASQRTDPSLPIRNQVPGPCPLSRPQGLLHTRPAHRAHTQGAGTGTVALLCLPCATAGLTRTTYCMALYRRVPT